MSGKVRLALSLIVVALSPAASAAPFLYATRPTTGEVVAIDLADGSLAGSLAAGALPSGAAIDAAGSRLVVADAAGDEARSFLLPGGAAVLATGDGPAGVTITPDGATVAIANTEADTVALFAASGGAPLATLPVGDAPLAVATDGVRLVVTNYGSATVSLVDLGSQAVTAVGVGAFPAGVAIAGGRAWVANFADDTVSVVDLSTSTVVATVAVGSAPRGVVAGGGRVYVGNLNDGTVSVLDVVTATVLATWTLPTGSPTDLLLSPAGDRLFASHPAATQLSVLDATTGVALPSLAVPGGLAAFAGIAGVGPGGVPGIPALSQLGLLALGLVLAALAVGRLRSVFAVALVAFAAAVAGSAARAQDVVFSDDDFVDSSWAIEQASVGNGSHQAFQSSSVGNPAPSRVMEAMSPPPSGGPEVVEVVHRFTDSTYDPAAQGAINTIDASWERLVVANDGYDDLAEAFVVVQGGTVFATTAASFSASSWQGVSRLGLGSLDFDDGSGGHPDLGAGGAPLSFGYLRRATHSSAGEAFVRHAIDGFVVTVHRASAPSEQGVLSFVQLTYVAVNGPPSITVARTGGTAGPASVEVNLQPPIGTTLVGIASWGDGEGGVRTVTFAAPGSPPGEIVRFNLFFSNEGPPGVTLAARQTAVLLYTSDPNLAGAIQLFGLLLSRLGPVAVLLLVPLALWAAWRRRALAAGFASPGSGTRTDVRNHRSRGWRLLVSLLAPVPILFTPGCVATDDVQLAVIPPVRFNERIRADLDALTAADIPTDLRYGIFRNGSDGGLVSELFPVAAATSSGAGKLVQTGCLFLGQSGSPGAASDQLQVVWEVIANVDRTKSPADVIFVDGHTEVGTCSASNPVNRLLGEDPASDAWPGPGVGHGLKNCQTVTLFRPDRLGELKNFPVECAVFHAGYGVRLDAHSPTLGDDDARCPESHFANGTVTQVVEGVHGYDRPTEGGLLPVCRVPAAALIPPRDTAYTVSLSPTWEGIPASPVSPDDVRERWLSPDVMVVAGTRQMVRPMSPRGGKLYGWQTGVDAKSAEPPIVRWAENFSPSVRVESVEVVSRGIGTSEQTERTDNQPTCPPGMSECPLLTILIPRPDTTTAAEVSCYAKKRDGHWTFLVNPPPGVSSDCDFGDLAASVGALTPTYAVANLEAASVVANPINWRANLSGLKSGRSPHLRFKLRAITDPGTLSISPLRDFGRVQVGKWSSAELILKNVGGEAFEIRKVRYGSPSPHSSDFSFHVVGDPVSVPLPIEAVPDSAGGVEYRWAADRDEAPLLTVKELDDGTVTVGLGDPNRGSGTEHLTLYGEPATLVGDLLLRDDPASRFEPASEPYPRPFEIPAVAERPLPFILSPGQEVSIAVIATPSVPGDRLASITVEAVEVARPTSPWYLTSQLHVEGIYGPLARLLPSNLYFNRPPEHPGLPPVRRALVENAGQLDLRITGLTLSGRSRGRFSVVSDRGAPPFTIPSGGSTDLTITYTPTCDGDYTLYDDEATLTVESNDRPQSLALSAFSYGFCELP